MAITWNDDAFSKVSKLNIGGIDYYIKDAAARAEIEKLSAYTKFLGVTTTALTDGSTTNPITIGGETVEAKSGDIAIYGSKEFIFNATEWAEFGDLDALENLLGNLAYNDTASAVYTPVGDISVNGSFAGSEATITVSGSTTGTVEIVADSATGNYTPIGQIDPDVKTTTQNVVYSATQGTLPTFTTSLLSASANASTETLTFTLVDNGFTQGTLPTFSTSDVVNSVTTSNPTFVGQTADITYSAAAITLSGSYTPELASVPTYSFVGSASTIVVEGSQSKPTT